MSSGLKDEVAATKVSEHFLWDSDLEKFLVYPA